jgi:hypothetical protein
LSQQEIDYTRVYDLLEAEAPLRPLLEEDGGRKGSGGRLLLSLAGALASGLLLVLVPCLILIWGGVLLDRTLGLSFAPGAALSALATLLLVVARAWWVGRRSGAPGEVRRALLRGAGALCVVYTACTVTYFTSRGLVEPAAARADYVRLHPLLRLALGPLVVADATVLLPVGERAPEDYWLMGLSRQEAALHFPQSDGRVRAVDIRVPDEPRWRDRALELGFWALGFNARRLTGISRHLHVSLRPAG